SSSAAPVSFSASEVVVPVWAPPVLTATPGGAVEVVDPVDHEAGSASGFDTSSGCRSDAGGVVAFSAASAPVGDCVLVDDSADAASGESGVSPQANPDPDPVTTAAPTPSATAKPPTRPTHAAE